MSSNHFFEGFELLHNGEEGDGLIVPRSFFERVVITEPASTIRVVAFILLRTLAGQSEVEASYSDFVRELRLCRQSVQEGLARAIEAGYIRLVQSGENGHIKSRYAICWATSSSSPTPSSPPPDKGGSSSNHHGSHSPSTTNSPTSTPPAISTLPVRKNQNATRPASTHSPTNRTSEEKQTGSLSRTLPSPAAVAGDSNKSSKVTSVTNKVSMINRRVESLVESGVPARKADQLVQQQAFCHSTFPSITTTPPAAIAPIPNSTIPPRSYYCPDSLAAASFPVCDTAAPLATKPTLAVSSYLSHLTRDLSREFGDISHKSSNRAQTHNLWHHSGLSEKEFAAVMYQARELTRHYAVLRVGEAPPPPGQPRNRMPYFFACLRDQLGFRGQEDSKNNSLPQPYNYPGTSSHRSSDLNDRTVGTAESDSHARLLQGAGQPQDLLLREEKQPGPHSQLEPSANASTNKPAYKRGSQWREAQAFSASSGPDATSSGYALVDGLLPASGGPGPLPELLHFNQRNPATAESEFTTDHTLSQVSASFEPENNPDAATRAVPSLQLFRGAEAQRRERYQAQFGCSRTVTPGDASQAESIEIT